MAIVGVPERKNSQSGSAAAHAVGSSRRPGPPKVSRVMACLGSFLKLSVHPISPIIVVPGLFSFPCSPYNPNITLVLPQWV